MPVLCEFPRLAYFPVPKVACTSLKHLMYRIEHGAEFEPHVLDTGEWLHIHSISESRPFPAKPEDFTDYFRFAVVRDPVDRLVSAYTNRVLHHQELAGWAVGEDRLAAQGLLPTPPFDVFVERLDAYCALSESIRHHTLPQTVFLDSDPDYFDLIVALPDLDRLIGVLSARTGLPLALRRMQETPPTIPHPKVTEPLRRQILDRYQGDLAAFSRLLRPR